jgi:hypothetical protein
MTTARIIGSPVHVTIAALAGSLLVVADLGAQFCPDADGALSTGGGTRPNAVIAEDVTGDGLPDLCTANDSNDNVSVLPALGAGVYGSPALLPVGDEPIWLAVVDIDGDGSRDIVTANRSSVDVSLLINDGSGSFTASTPLPLIDPPIRIAAAHLDGNDDIDLVLTSSSANTVSVLLAQGGGAFAAPIVYPTDDEAPTGLSLVDIDGDGDRDIVAGNSGASLGQGTVAVLENDGGGQFDAATTFPVGANAFDIVAADIDGVAGPDVVTVDGIANVITVVLNDGDGTFGTPVTYSGGTGGYAITACDLDCDGLEDVATVNLVSDDLTYFLNAGGGVLGSPVSVPIGSNPSSAACRDLDGDGGVDLAVAYREGVIPVTNACSDCDVVAVPMDESDADAYAPDVHPNPAAGRAHVVYATERGGATRIQVFDARGALVRTLADGDRPAGRYTVLWDGYTSSATEAPPGVYFVRVESPDGAWTRRLVRVR